jgi:hypothetical protein
MPSESVRLSAAAVLQSTAATTTPSLPGMPAVTLESMHMLKSPLPLHRLHRLCLQPSALRPLQEPELFRGLLLLPALCAPKLLCVCWHLLVPHIMSATPFPPATQLVAGALCAHPSQRHSRTWKRRRPLALQDSSRPRIHAMQRTLPLAILKGRLEPSPMGSGWLRD